MAYSTREASTEDGRPIYLYEFKLGDTIWRYCTADRPVSAVGFTWLATAAEDSGVKQTGDALVDNLAVALPTDAQLVGIFNVSAPINPIILTMRRWHYGDPDAAVCYVGQVTSVDSGSPTAATVNCSTLSASLERNGLRLCWSRNCPYSLYDMSCGVDPSNFSVAATIEGISGNALVLTIESQLDDGWFNGGYIEWSDPVRGTERRALDQHVGNQITLLGTNSGIVSGQDITLYPGCSRTITECQTKFNNHPRYGGVPTMPNKSPFDGNPVY